MAQDITQSNKVRDEMKSYWNTYSTSPSQNTMMLDFNSDELCKNEMPEIMELMPPFEGKTIMELGAGIGRFTKIFANKAEYVLAVDFMDEFIQKNKEENGTENVEYIAGDVLKIKDPAQKFDIVFSNWLFMYLDDDECIALLQRIISWLKPEGYLFLRESCFVPSGNKKFGDNPTFYRSPRTYFGMIHCSHYSSTDSDELFGLETIICKPIQAYALLKDNPNQLCWLLQKISQKSDGYTTLQQFLDKSQYSRNGILRYEMIFGKDFVSTGGMETTVDLVSRLNLKALESVLEVGAGIGGGAFYMAKNFNVKVLGLDLSSNMISIALERLHELKLKQVLFEVSDATKRDYGTEKFDVIYSRDTILHIEDKQSLFKSFYRWLKPGGRLLISDYCCTPGAWSPDYKLYVAQRGYHLMDVKNYGKLIETAGFCNVQADDASHVFGECLRSELKKLTEIKDEFLQKFSQEDYEAIANGWKDKIVRNGNGYQRWGIFYAEKDKI